MLFNEVVDNLRSYPKKWLITGAAGFIGSNLVEFLLSNKQKVIGLDDFSIGKKATISNLKSLSNTLNADFTFLECDITSLANCHKACLNVDYVLHHAALSSVPGSVVDPLAAHAVNATGFLNMLVAARDAEVKGFVYASSSAIYGDDVTLPKRESIIGNQLSPYAVTKYINELYAANFADLYDFRSIGLRYFNIFGPGQNPNGAYAAVIPIWMQSMLCNDNVYINGDGKNTRDFCYIDNVVQANILAATKVLEDKHAVFNIAMHEETSLQDLFIIIRDTLAEFGVEYSLSPLYCDARQGDIRYSTADISNAKVFLGFNPYVGLKSGIKNTIHWHLNSQQDNRLTKEV